MRISNPPVFNRIIALTGETLEVYAIEIGAWNMDGAGSTTILHNLSLDVTKIVQAKAMIHSDNGGAATPLDSYDNGTTDGVGGGINSCGTNQITLERVTGGKFDNTAYDDTGINRGYVMLWIVQ